MHFFFDGIDDTPTECFHVIASLVRVRAGKPDFSLEEIAQMQDRPNAAEILDAVATLLTDSIMPELDGQKRFHVRVAANLLRILEREWTFEGDNRDADRAALAALLDTDASLEDLAGELVDRIRAGEVDDREPEVLEVLRGIARRKLSITNPRYILDESG
jgi:hypothetical protein